MLIVYLNRIGGDNADVSYNIAWEFMCAIAEISFGLTVAGAFSLPKLVEAKSTTLRRIFSSLKRPFTSITSGSSSGIIMQSRVETNPPPGAMTDEATLIGNSERSSIQPDHDIERYPSYDGVHDPVKFPDVNITEAPHRFWSRWQTASVGLWFSGSHDPGEIACNWMTLFEGTLFVDTRYARRRFKRWGKKRKPQMDGSHTIGWLFSQFLLFRAILAAFPPHPRQSFLLASRPHSRSGSTPLRYRKTSRHWGTSRWPI